MSTQAELPKPFGSSHNDAMIKIALHDSHHAADHRDNVLHVWNEVFGAVGDADNWLETVWDRHRARADYRSATAYDDDRLVAFSWGYTGQRSQLWSGTEDDPSSPAVRLYPGREWRRLGKQWPTDQVMGRILDGRTGQSPTV